MTLITILIALLLEKYSNWHTKLRDTRWFCRYVDWMYAKFSDSKWVDGPVGVILIITPAVVIVGAIFSILDGYHSFYSFIFSILVLSFSIGPNKFYEEVKKFVQLKQQGDNEGALWYLDKILEKDFSKNEPLLILKLTEAILIQTSKRLLSVLFWFVVLGPIGAILFRLANAMHDDKIENKEDSQFTHAAARLQYILHWIPSRLTALSYAISGSFVHASECWKNTREDSHQENVRTHADKNDDMLTCIGLSALQLGATDQNEKNQELNFDSVNETLKLSLRSVIVWVTVFAIMTLAGWMN